MNEPREYDEFPDCFNDTDVFGALTSNAKFHKYKLCCGLLIRLRSALFRIYKRSQYKFKQINEENDKKRLWLLIESFTKDTDVLFMHWSEDLVWSVSIELTEKVTNLPDTLKKELMLHTVPVPDTQGRLNFSVAFLKKVREYHKTVQRPEGTFDLKMNERLKLLYESPRARCNGCHGNRQIYCGPCIGIRMDPVVDILPPRIALPFNILLLLHWQESMVKCTGVHAGAMSEEGTVELVNWNKEKSDEDWWNIIGKLDPKYDVLLFPAKTAIPANEFDWSSHGDDSDVQNSLDSHQDGENSEYNNNNSNNNINNINKKRRKWRLIVLEGSWNYAKTMANQIIEYREKMKLLPLPCVILTEITGQYWRFQSEGNAAVSTIEAIAYTAKAAGITEEQFEDFLTLFYLQKYNVLQNIENGGRIPKAMEVMGTGLGSWKELTQAIEEV